MNTRIDQQFGSYRLEKLIGRGGFAEVSLGVHIHLRSQVAVKVLNTQLISREQEEFLEEARIVAALDHPSIVRVLDCGIREEDETPYLVMNYAPNGTLRQRHPKGDTVPFPLLLSYVKKIASALQYAHDKKLIHRDIKPENMLIGINDEILLSDFGIALMSASSTSQSTKAAAGTIAYMAPEQIMGKPRQDFSSSNCTHAGGWTCVVTVSADAPNGATTHWSVSPTTNDGTSFSPSGGSLAPGAATQVTITIPATSCPTTNRFDFMVAGGEIDAFDNFLSFSC